MKCFDVRSLIFRSLFLSVTRPARSLVLFARSFIRFKHHLTTLFLEIPS